MSNEPTRLTCISITTEMLARVLGLPKGLQIKAVLQEGHTVATGEVQIYVEDPTQPEHPPHSAVRETHLRVYPVGWHATNNGPTVYGAPFRDNAVDRRVDGALDPELHQYFRQTQREYTAGIGWHDFGSIQPENWERPLRHVDISGDR